MLSSWRHDATIWPRALATCAIAIGTVAQQPRTPPMPAPPPMRFVSPAERAELNRAKDPKARLLETIDLAENHLKRCEQLTDQKRFDDASAELGSYLALIGDMRLFIARMDPDHRSTRDLYRHFEIAVRAHIPRIAVMRRSTPASYTGNLKDAEEYIEDTREEALDSFFGRAVLSEESGKTARPKSGASPEPQKQPQ